MNTISYPNSVKLIPFNLKKETSKIIEEETSKIIEEEAYKIAEEEASKIAKEEMQKHFGELVSDSHVSCEIEPFVEFNSSFTRLF